MSFQLKRSELRKLWTLQYDTIFQRVFAKYLENAEKLRKRDLNRNASREVEEFYRFHR